MKNLDETKLNKREREAIKAASNLLKSRFPVENVILFGSKARGDDNPESDIDLLVLTSYPLPWRERKEITYSLFEVEMTYDVVISTLVTTISEWRKGAFPLLPIYDEISQDGVLA